MDLCAKEISHRLIFFEQLSSEVIAGRVSRAQACCCLLVLPSQFALTILHFRSCRHRSKFKQSAN